MTFWKKIGSLSCFAVLSGCAAHLTPSYTDHPNLKAAEIARARGDIPQAIHDYRDIIQEAPNCEKAYIGLGMSLLDANVIDESKKTFEKAIGVFPLSAPAHAGLGAVYLTINQPENAISSFDRALCINPRYAKALNGMGIALDMIGDHRGAQANYQAAMELDPANVSYESNFALSLALSGNAPQAVHILERLAGCPNATPRVRQNLSLAYGLAGDMKMAKQVGKIDLSEDWIKNNISYIEAIKETREYSGLIPENHSIPLDQARKWQNTH